MAANPIVNLITQGARARGLDPAAVLAVASQEGLSGRIGDGGHAYGPFQLNNAGGVITNTHPGTNDPRIQAWASSPDGINFALDHMAAVAKGLRGPQAVSAIVSRFEKPANVPKEVAGANAAYGNYGALPAAAPTLPSLTAPAGAPAVPPPRGLSSALVSAVNTGNQMFGLPPLPTSLLSPVAPTAAPTLAPPAARTLPIPSGPGGGQGAVRGFAVLAPGADRQGVAIQPAVLNFVGRIGQLAGHPLTIGTGTNHNEFVQGTHRESDHWTGYAADIPASGAALTRLGQTALVAAGADPAWARKQTGGLYNIGGKQIIFNSMEGGNHYNHLHVGIRTR